MYFKKKTNFYVIFISSIIFLIFLFFITHLFYVDVGNKMNNIENLQNNQENTADNPKYKLSILAIFKNETMNLKVWIDHYLWQGCEHIYLIDNGSTDNPDEILKPYIDNRQVSLYKLTEKHKQVEHYKTVWKDVNMPTQTKWLIMADLDEFFFAPNNKLIDVIDKFDDYDVIYTKWKMFGTDGNDKHPKDIRTSIVYRTLNNNDHKKWICKTKKITEENIGIHDITGENIKSINENEKIQLNHYPIQSKEFYSKVKMTRGAADSIHSENVRDWNYFNKYNENMDVKDTILKDMVELDLHP